MLAKKRLLSAIAGLAILALPMTALASDHHRHWDAGVFARPIVTANQPRANFWRGPGLVSRHPNYTFNPGHNWNYRQYGRNWMPNSYPGWNSASASSYVAP